MGVGVVRSGVGCGGGSGCGVMACMLYMLYKSMCGFMLKCAVHCMIHMLLSSSPLCTPLQCQPHHYVLPFNRFSQCVRTYMCTHWAFQH